MLRGPTRTNPHLFKLPAPACLRDPCLHSLLAHLLACAGRASALAGIANPDEPLVDGDCSYAVFSTGIGHAVAVPTGNLDYPDVVMVLDGTSGVRRVAYTHWAFAQPLQPLPTHRTCLARARLLCLCALKVGDD